jgi:hypothetical protein
VPLAPDAGARSPGTAGLARQPRSGGDGQDAAAVRPEATAIQEAADKEAVHLRAVILSLSEQLGLMSAYITENLAGSGGVATVRAPAVAPARVPAIAPYRSARPAGLTAPAAPARPGSAPAEAPQKRSGRQLQAMRVASAATAVLFSVAAVTGAAEIALHGFKFFIFRETGVGESGPNAPTDQQFVAQQAVAAKAAAARAHTPGRHSAKKTSGS